MIVDIDTTDPASYRTFLAAKSLPVYRVQGRSIWFPDEYAARLGLKPAKQKSLVYMPSERLFDYQAAIAEIAIRKRKFAIFADPGLGKTFMLGEYVKHVLSHLKRTDKVLWVNPCMVTPQTITELTRFYGAVDMTPDAIPASKLQSWLDGEWGGRFGITNFEALRGEITQGRLKALIVDESGIMKSAYGTYGKRLIALGRGLEWKLCATGTPAPNDRIEYASHAVFLDQFPNVNSFLAKYFVNRGQTDNRWELKPHALRPFYRDISHWSIFLSNPATYGWQDNCDTIPPIHVHIHDVPLTAEQRDAVYKLTGQLIPTKPGGITKRSAFSRIAKGMFRGKPIPTHKYEYILELVSDWDVEESAIIWCWFDDEQGQIEKHFPGCASIRGATKYAKRIELIDRFKSGDVKELVSKPVILGFGLNLQVASRQVFSSLIDSYEKYFQCVKRSNRIGSTSPLNVHIPITEIEAPMVESVLRKAHRVEQDTREQEELFKDAATA